jgi:mRNA interferase RelE/StbE
MNVVFTRSALKQLKKIDITNQKKIKQFILDIQELNDPRSKGKALKGKLSNYWRYRVGDYRLICDINDSEIIITVVRIGHRKDIYTRIEV